MVTRSEPGYVWDFCGGQLAVDFTNTVGDRGSTPDEHFNTYPDVIAWAEARGVLSRGDAQQLQKEAARQPAAAHSALVAAIAFRDAPCPTLPTSAAGRKPAPADLAIVNEQVAAAYGGARLAPRKGTVA